MTLSHARARASVGLCPLDQVAAAAAAFSVRKLRVGYTGSALQVRRSSDNTTQDIGFKGQILDTAAMLTFCGAGNGFVSKWYDQSGNSNDAVQATVADQPQIVSSGSVLTMGGRPTITFDTTDYFSVADAASIALTGALTIHSIVSVPDITTFRWMAAKLVANGATTSTFEYRISTSGFPELYQTDGASLYAVASTTQAAVSTKMGLAVTRSGSGSSTVIHYRNGATAGSGTLAAGPVSTTNPLLIGTRDDQFTHFNGSMGEIVFFASALSAGNVSALYGGF